MTHSSRPADATRTPVLKPYSAPRFAVLGSIVELTLGGGPTDLWDFAMDYVREEPPPS